MKVYIVFLGIFILNISFISYQINMNNLIVIEGEVKQYAEEMAAGAAQYFDASEFASGRYVFNTEESLKWISRCAESIAPEILKRRNTEFMDISVKVSFYDDSGNARVYHDSELYSEYRYSYPLSVTDTKGYNYTVKYPCVIVELDVSFSDIFPSEELNCDNIVRSAMYEQKNYNHS